MDKNADVTQVLIINQLSAIIAVPPIVVSNIIPSYTFISVVYSPFSISSRTMKHLLRGKLRLNSVDKYFRAARM